MGSFRPDITNVVLESCCKKTLTLIGEKIDLNNLAQNLFFPAVFASLFISPSGRGAAMSTIIGIKQTDWASLANAVKEIAAATKYAVRREASFEASKHTGQLSDFWEGIADTFK